MILDCICLFEDLCLMYYRLNPYADFAYDGLLLNPLEVLFVKVKEFHVQTKWLSAMMATTYDRWLSQVTHRHTLACIRTLTIQTQHGQL